jgi:hypothetical protein
MQLPDAPDQGWIPFLKLGFGFCLLLVFGLLARGIALGQIQSATSYGLDIILGGLVSLSGAFGSWAFREITDSISKKEEK